MGYRLIEILFHSKAVSQQDILGIALQQPSKNINNYLREQH